MGIKGDLHLNDLIGLISEEPEESTEAKEEKEADFSSDEISCLQAKEKLRKAKIQNDILAESLERLKQDRDQRKDFAFMIFEFMCVYLFAVFFIIILNGITVNHFHVSDDIILALLGTTAIEVIGTFAFVARYLFGNK